MQTQINSIYDIQKLALSGFNDWQSLGNVAVSQLGNLCLFNYTQAAMYEGQWNLFERISRGLIINSQTGEIVARPFDKFFNWGEGERYTNASIKLVTEKMDGSLGILYRANNNYHIATKGSFESEQALWATEFLNQNYKLSALDNRLTLLFEIIYPDNRIVVDYEGREDLVLLAIRNRESGSYLSWESVKICANLFGFSLPQVYEFDTPDKIVQACESLPANNEGWVVEFANNQRFKFKGEEYKKLHKLISGLSFKKVLDCVMSNTLNDLKAIIPDEFMGEVNIWISEIQQTVQQTHEQIEVAFQKAPKNTRKDFALWVREYHKPLSPYLFAKLDNRPIEEMIYKLAFGKQEV